MLSSINVDLQSFETKAGGIVKELQDAVGEVAEAITGLKTKWMEGKKEADERYLGILRSLQRDKIDGSEFLRLGRMIEELRPLQEQRLSLLQELKEEQAKRRDLLVEWEEVRSRYRFPNSS